MLEVVEGSVAGPEVVEGESAAQVCDPLHERAGCGKVGYGSSFGDLEDQAPGIDAEMIEGGPDRVGKVEVAERLGGKVDLELAARNIGASPLRTFFTVTLPLAAPGVIASGIFVFLESLDEFTGTFFVGVPQVTTLPLLLYNAAMGGNYQVASITALILLVPSVLFMLFIERFLRADVLAKVGA